MTLSMKDDPDFWTRILALREPAWREPGEDDLLNLQDDIFEAVQQLASRISLRAQDYRAAGQDLPDAAIAAPDYQLAVLRALHTAQRTIDTFAATAAKNAGHTGASYTKLGAAWGGITRQSARLRWPDAVHKRGTAPQPIELELAGGHAEISELPDGAGYTWEAVGYDEAVAEENEACATVAEAAAQAGAFLQLHAYDHAAAHAACTRPHVTGDGYVDCDGQPV
ncbi:hypothetical protein [Streptomyces sp. NPDC002133]|uniref:hypothetical protein n=1 Tax=Streptomyces sp. NPDC002133 TaxID=3154409 RepID=UPI003327C5B0